MLSQLFQHYRTENVHEGLKLYDVFTILYLIDADLFNVFDANVQIELQGILTKGATVVDFNSIEPNCQVVHSLFQIIINMRFYKRLLIVNKSKRTCRMSHRQQHVRLYLYHYHYFT